MKDLKTNIIITKPRERSGSISSNRFDFQKDWAICKLLELHSKPDDYLLTLEHHDDIIIFDSSSEPNKISFFQVKTNNKSKWTIKQLIKQEKGKASLLNSPLGKLYEHLLNFEEDVESLNFITNNKIKGVLADNTKCEDTAGFCVAELCSSDLDTILNALKKEHSLNDLKNFKDITFFKLGELDIDKHSDLTKALIVNFLDKNFPDLTYQIAPLYKSIFDEIKMKSDYEKEVTNFDELKSRKSISREGFSKYLEELKDVNSIPSQTTSIESRLNSEGVDFNIITNFRRQSRIYEIKKMSYNDKAFKVIEQKIRDVKNNLDLEGKTELQEIHNSILEELDFDSIVTNNIDSSLIHVMIYYIIYE